MANDKEATMTEADDAMVKAAELRANIIGWLNQNPGKHTVAEIASSLGLGEETSRVAYACNRLADSGEIKKGREGTANVFSSKGRRNAEPEAVPLKRGRKPGISPFRKGAATGAKEVELVMAGVMIVVGKNPTTGRLRIMLEEVGG